MMTLAALLLCATQVNAQTARVADRELIGAWTMEWMQYDGEKKIVCGKTNGYTQFKYYGPDGEYACAEIVLLVDGPSRDSFRCVVESAPLYAQLLYDRSTVVRDYQIVHKG